MSGVLNVLLANRAAVVAAGSGWGAHGTRNDLSTTTVANDTVTSNTGNWGTVRGTQAYSTGKRYFEILVITHDASDLFIPGLNDATTATGSGMDNPLGQFADGVGHLQLNGAGFHTGTGYSTADPSGWSLADGDLMGVAFDGTNGFHYLSVNGVYLNSGVPTSGALGTGAVGIYTSSQTLFPALSTFTIGASFKLITATGSLANLPSGYSAWN